MFFNKIEKLINPKIEYCTFILQDTNPNLQKETLLNLYYLSQHYKCNKIQKNEKKEKTDYKKPKLTYKRHALHLLKISLLDNTPYKLPIPSETGFYNLQNFIFLLALLKKRPEIVYEFLKKGFPSNINDSTFASDLSPTYFQLSCVLSDEIWRLMMDFNPSYSLSYNGLTPQMLCISKNLFLYDKQEWSFLTTTQYKLLNQFNLVKIINNEENPIFLLDLYCMENNTEMVKKLLQEDKGLINYSKCCFVVNSTFEVMEVLAVFSIDIIQKFCKMSPLHVSAYLDDINHAVTSIMVKIDCNLQDENGDTPLHIAARCKSYKVLEILIRSKGDVNIKNKQGKTPKDLYDENEWKMVPPNYKENDVLVNLADMDYNNPEFKCSSVSMRHIMNIKNYKEPSRFTITSLVTFYSREKEAKKMIYRLRTTSEYKYRKFRDLEILFNEHLYKR
ncbi:ankyrin repeat protein [Vairimorpha necatrix]|uniref:Ankyrin repeat protein n=1 Tax=Vairimorpha necatrix TaxID=6039 RepID=A0AAX4JCM3_9MICR